MKAVFQTGIQSFEIRELPKPEIGPGDVLFRVRAVGICGSDIHYWNEGRIGDQMVEYPFILGHECAGEVEAVGKDVKGIIPGVRAAFEPGLPCEECEFCRTGRYNTCPDVRFLGTPPIAGAFQEYLVGKPRQILPLPDSVSLEAGALLEPLAVGTYAVRYSGFRVTDTAAVIGAGPIGLSVLSALKAGGAGQTVVTEIRQHRLTFAAEEGVDLGVDAQDTDPIQAVMDATAGRGVDFAFEAAGSQDGFAQAVRMARVGGTVVLVGICDTDDVSLPMHIARKRELEIKLVRREAFGYRPALTLLEKGMGKVDHWVTHRFPPDEIQKAFELVHEYGDGVIKAMITL